MMARQRTTMMLFAMLVTVLISESVAGSFSCSDLASFHTCSCSSHTPTVFELLCQDQLAVQINLQESVQFQCNSEVFNFSAPAGMHIGDVTRFVLRLCPLPTMSIREIMTNMGINKISMLQIQSYSSLNNTLKKKHFEKLKEVTNLSLNNNGLTSLPIDIFEEMGNLTWLDMKFNYIDYPKEIFYFTPKLEVLELGKNNLTDLKPGIFKNLDRLRLLNLWGNNLKNLNRSVFSDVPNLESLDLSSNNMETMRPDLFADLNKLKILNLYANAFSSLPQGLLSRNTDLEEFQMHENKRAIVTLPSGFLANLNKLKTVKLCGTKLIALPEDTFFGSSNIEKIYLNRNSLATLQANTFADLPNLEFLDLSQNKITHLPEGLFSKTNKLKTLKLHYNQLQEIPQKLFSGLKKIVYIDLRFNRIKEIRGSQFYDLESLKALNISDNQLTTLATELQLSDGLYSALHNCLKLEDLQLANNSLNELYDDWIKVLNKLHTLNLALNNFTTVKIDELDFFSDVTIDFSNNNITLVNFWPANYVASNHVNQFNSTYTRDAAVKTKRIVFANNPFKCDCQLLPFVQFFRNELSPEVQYLFNIPADNLKCHEPMALENLALNRIHPRILTCEFPKSFKCPEGCSCHYRSFDKGYVVNCVNGGLHQIPSPFPLPTISNHSEFNFENNQLEYFEIPRNSCYENVTHFYLAKNNIKNFNASGLSKDIEVLDLSNNKLKMLTPETISFLQAAVKLKNLQLHGNPWECGCEIKPLIGLIKNKFEEVKHSYNITCSDGTLLQGLEESELCTNFYAVFGWVALALGVVGVLFGFLCGLYCKYQTQIHIYCFSSKWKVLRWMVSRPDIDEDKIYDAFVSFSHEDDKFVTEYLVPYLEEHGETKFKLCLHYRDWVPGEEILTQILQSVKNSRRTIVVLSPNFLKSVWGITEFKTAHAEALKDSTVRVIPVLYQDVGPISELDEELRIYLQMTTYVKWGSPSFWQQLKWAMPHPYEDASDIDCIFGCFSRLRNRPSQSHIMQNVQMQNGQLYSVSEASDKVNEKDINISIPSDTKPSPLIINTNKAKSKHTVPEDHHNEKVAVCA